MSQVEKAFNIQVQRSVASIHSFPKIFNLGDSAIGHLFEGPVEITEKVDGSQFSFGVFDGEIRVRSKGREFDVNAPDGLFVRACATVIRLAPGLHDGWTYRGECVQKPKHNVLTYDRSPEGGIILFDIADELKRVMCKHGAYEINSWQLSRLMKSIFTQVPPAGQHGTMNKAFIGKNAGVLLKEIGIDVGDEVRLVLVEVERDHPLVLTEQMMPIIPLVQVRDADEGIDLAKLAEHGFRHTAVMHSKNLDHLSRMAREMGCSIFACASPEMRTGPTLMRLSAALADPHATLR